MRVCWKCNQELPLEQFVVDRRCHEGRTRVCRKCTNQYINDWKHAHPQKRCGQKRRQAQGKIAYDMLYTSLLRQQTGQCALCGSQPRRRLSGNGFNFDVDHDHETGKIRGLLCRSCNLMLGLLERPKITLEKIREYLDKVGNEDAWR